ncbi:hypothetical protein [Luteibacter sp. Lutesp34]|uniref:hypothetical protein n=1 Tax=Luteibacter sp. Lutesp34 TaxID=3243030 RepID=UPI0039B3CCF0
MRGRYLVVAALTCAAVGAHADDFFRDGSFNGYTDDNVYYPSTYHGDSMYGNNVSLPRTAREADGTTAIGTTYAAGGWKAQAWYYDFEHFGRMGYVDGIYTFKTPSCRMR